MALAPRADDDPLWDWSDRADGGLCRALAPAALRA
jgi:hypothetical protein